MKDNLSKPGRVTMEQAILVGQKEVERFVEAETDPMLRAILGNSIDFSPANIAFSIKENFIEGSVYTKPDGSINTLRSTINIDITELVKHSLEKTKNNYLSQQIYMEDPENIKMMYVHEIIVIYDIKEEWDLWALQSYLSPDQAIPLMNGVDPDSWAAFKKGEIPLPQDMAFSIKQGLIIALAKVFTLGTPIQWIEWGREHGLDKSILKSDEELELPDVSMFFLFESAVLKATKPCNKKKIRNDELQSRLENMAAKEISEGYKSQSTKGKLAKKLSAEIGVDSATIERNTLKTW